MNPIGASPACFLIVFASWYLYMIRLIVIAKLIAISRFRIKKGIVIHKLLLNNPGSNT